MTNYGVHKYKKVYVQRPLRTYRLAVSTVLRAFVYDNVAYASNFSGTLRIDNGVLYSFDNPIAKQVGDGFVVAQYDRCNKSKTHVDQLCTMIYVSCKDMEVVSMSEVENA